MTDRLPIFPLQTVLFPGHLLPLHIFEPRYRLMTSRHAGDDPFFGVVLTRSGTEVGDQPETYEIGTSTVSLEHFELPDGRSNLLVKGVRRFHILESAWDEGYMTASIRWLDVDDPHEAEPGFQVTVRRITEQLNLYLRTYNQATGSSAALKDLENDPVAFAYGVAATLPMPVETRQRLLEARPPEQLLALLEETVRFETALIARTGAYATLPGHAGTRFTRN